MTIRRHRSLYVTKGIIFIMMDMINRLKRNVNENNLFSAADLLILAVSGGADSAVMTDVLAKAGYSFVIAHMNFNLRAAESRRDEDFVRSLASLYNTQVYVENVDAAAYSSENNLSIQEAARILRYSWFDKVRQQLPANPNSEKKYPDVKIVTAHHKDDSVETMMMHLFRGTGIAGLRGINAVNGKIVRPMLVFTKDEIRDYALQNGLKWVEDSSNQLDKYTRNYFRNQFIPLLKNIYPNVEQNLYANLERFTDTDKLYRLTVDQKLKKLQQVHDNEIHIPVRKLKKEVAWGTLLFELLHPLGFTSGQVEQVILLADADTGKQVISEQYRVFKNRDWMIIAPVAVENSAYHIIDNTDAIVQIGSSKLSLELFDRPAVEFNKDKPGVPVETSNAIAWLDAGKISWPLLLRRQKTGDYFYPLGMKKKKKIARFMIDAKLSRTQKESAWVLESAGKIIWLVNMRIDDRVSISSSTVKILKIRTSP
ncbi:MAG: tRNA lysidine(34) synthetase TilS [Flavitalea sp.]